MDAIGPTSNATRSLEDDDGDDNDDDDDDGDADAYVNMDGKIFNSLLWRDMGEMVKLYQSIVFVN